MSQGLQAPSMKNMVLLSITYFTNSKNDIALLQEKSKLISKNICHALVFILSREESG
jgi:hypothetical protein